MEGLSLENILGEQEIENLFMEPREEKTSEEPSENSEEVVAKETVTEKEEHSETNNETTEVDPEELFGEEPQEKPESVGSGSKKEVKGTGDATTEEDSGTSPKENFYSSIANALAVDGIFPNLDEETVRKADTAEGLSDLIEAEVMARLDEKQQRVSKALSNGVEASEIRRYEGVLNQLNSMKESDISAETPEGERLRYSLISQDFLNKGWSDEKADKMAKRSIDNGTDLEDAKEALQSNKEYFQKRYNTLLKEAEDAAEQERENRKKQAEKLRDSIMTDKELLGDMEISQDLRKKVFENISKPVFKNPETGEYLTSIQRYEQEHPSEFLKYASLFYTLTNGFKDFDGLVKSKVKKEVRKGLSDLEKTLNSTSRNSNGSLRMVTSMRDDPNSFIGSGFRLDL